MYFTLLAKRRAELAAAAGALRVVVAGGRQFVARDRMVTPKGKPETWRVYARTRPERLARPGFLAVTLTNEAVTGLVAEWPVFELRAVLPGDRNLADLAAFFVSLDAGLRCDRTGRLYPRADGTFPGPVTFTPDQLRAMADASVAFVANLQASLPPGRSTR
ncbi:hypothetical protein [Falsiroseomonas sp.]|uniref:hypothetical protein n=1 Tax=Falsiroseomonas sp. TaxID=2870721 RepID=UPI003F72A038